MIIRLGCLMGFGVVLACAACDRVGFTYVDNDPPPRRVVVEHHTPREVHVVEHHPVEEVHVYREPVHHDVHVVERRPVQEVHVHHDSHCCTSSCNHYWDGGRFVVVSHGHRHGPGCGHHFDGKRWGIQVHKGKAKTPPPPQKYKRD